MAYLDITKIKQEMTVFLRNQDIFTIVQRGVTTATETFSGNAVLVDFTLAQSNLKNVRSVTVGGSPITFGSGYTVNYDTYTITFATAPGTGTDNISIQYDYGSTDKIFPDFPRPDLSISSFPRIGFGLIGIDSGDAGFGNVLSSDLTFQINVYDSNRQDLENYLDVIRQAIIDNRDSFYYLKRIIPIATGPFIKSAFGKEKIVQKNIDIRSILNYEIN